MKLHNLRNTAASLGTLAAVLLAGTLINAGAGRASDRSSEYESDFRIRQGFRIAPVHLNLHGKDRALVGLGSYIMNAASDCNSCHTLSPQMEFVAGANPYLLGQQQRARVNPDVYLGGGNDFGPLDGPNGVSAHIISRNLTPDSTGRPEGGASFEEFLDHIRHGNDTDHWHPTCAGELGTGCVAPPFDGEKLQL